MEGHTRNIHRIGVSALFERRRYDDDRTSLNEAWGLNAATPRAQCRLDGERRILHSFVNLTGGEEDLEVARSRDCRFARSSLPPGRE